MLRTNKELAEIVGTFPDRIRMAFKTAAGNKYKPIKKKIFNTKVRRYIVEDCWDEEASDWVIKWLQRKELQEEKQKEAEEKRLEAEKKPIAEDKLAALRAAHPLVKDDRCFKLSWWPDTSIDIED